eukprot:TRINITY_DN12587_c0_g2_i1.p1 TRINITY_DN12587_c0_g2~~TRINITY_DN12587_c0_g2_i1.p1  ORF type:complete len:715 (+),score=150.08 TRINITY_DN12587_c0_g2_i1:131-2146(+)
MVSANALLQLTLDGDLVLRDSVSFWRSNTSGFGVTGAVLQENGNLVLKGQKGFVWESFWTPSDTLVAGQVLGLGGTLRAASGDQSTDSYYNLVLDRSGELVLKWESNVSYWDSGTKGMGGLGTVFTESGILGIFDKQGKRIWDKYSKDFSDRKVVLRFLRVDMDGNLRMYSWVEGKGWDVGWQALENQCDVFATCGEFGVCGFGSSGPLCKCPFGKNSKVAGKMGGSVCSGDAELGSSDCADGSTMVTMKNTVLYSIYPPHDFTVEASEVGCKQICLQDTQCVAATALNNGSGVCWLKKTRYFSGFSFDSVSATSFFKICLVPRAVSGSSGVDPPLMHPHPSPPPPSTSYACKTFCILDASLGTVGVFLVLESVVFFLIWKTRRRDAKSSFMNGNVDNSGGSLFRMSFQELEEVTDKFKERVGSSVFRAVLKNGKSVVIKQIGSEVGEKQFRMTAALLGSVHHKNLVQLQGFCLDSSHRYLIYGYAPNGSLDQWLFGCQFGLLSWPQRMGIASGIARAIAYLHAECRECICHGNLKPENVLLDQEFNAKVTGFGLSKLQPEASSNPSNCPEWDVYRFGWLLLQIVTGKRANHDSDDLVFWVSTEYYRGHMEAIIDKRIEEFSSSELERVIRIALWCMQLQASLRPSMSEVFKVLDGTLEVDPPPPFPHPLN